MNKILEGGSMKGMVRRTGECDFTQRLLERFDEMVGETRISAAKCVIYASKVYPRDALIHRKGLSILRSQAKSIEIVV